VVLLVMMEQALLVTAWGNFWIFLHGEKFLGISRAETMFHSLRLVYSKIYYLFQNSSCGKNKLLCLS
jgi:hypothetical protein